MKIFFSDSIKKVINFFVSIQSIVGWGLVIFSGHEQDVYILVFGTLLILERKVEKINHW